MSATPEIPANFRKLPFDMRAAFMSEHYGYRQHGDNPECADTLIEQAIGYKQIPLGIAGPLIVNEHRYHIPLATEEPSVVAALTYGAAIINRAGGVRADCPRQIISGQVVLTHLTNRGVCHLRAHKSQLYETLHSELRTLADRGGGCIDMIIRPLRPTLSPSNGKSILIEFSVDPCDAMGANRINSAAEAVARVSERISGGRRLLAILSNAADKAPVRASCMLPFSLLSRHGRDTAQRIAEAARFAMRNRQRAITHNKGIMNAITALALATGNDSRAVEACAHSYASRKGYAPLTSYTAADGMLTCIIEIPLPLATVGGSVGATHDSLTMLQVLNVNNSASLRAVAAAGGLAQNFAALLALVTDGIQHGHMRLHRRKMRASEV